jgi:hypothetical protein
MIIRNKIDRKIETNASRLDPMKYLMLIKSSDSGTEYVEEEDRDQHIDQKEICEEYTDEKFPDFR